VKKCLSLVLALLLVLSLASLAHAEDITLTYACFSAAGAQEDTLKKMIQVFEDKNPGIKIDVQLTGYNDYFTKLATQQAGGTTADVFELNMENFLAYMLRGACADLSGTSIDWSKFSGATVAAVSNGDKAYAVPMSFSTCLLIYNKNLFDKAGVAYPDDKWTWADIESAAEKIKAAGGEDVWGIYQPITYNELYKSVRTNGGSLLNADNSAFTVNSPENAAVLDAMIKRVRDTKVMPTSEDLAGRGDWDLFQEGKLGMIITGIWAFPTFTEKVKDAWDVAVEPGFTDTKATFFFANVNCVSTDAKNKEVAVKFVEAMGSDPDIVQLRLDANWELPTISDQSKLSQYLEVTPPDNREAVFKSMDYAVAPPALLESSAVAEIVNNVLSTLESRDMTAQQALDEIQSQLEQADLLK
jgi:multiple sugar transport system substrate-binding protein